MGVPEPEGEQPGRDCPLFGIVRALASSCWAVLGDGERPHQYQFKLADQLGYTDRGQLASLIGGFHSS